ATDLEHLFLGGLPEEEVEALEQHVLSCGSCLGTLKLLFRTKENLAGVLSDNSPGAPFVFGPVVDDLVAKLKVLGPASASSPGQEIPRIRFPCLAGARRLDDLPSQVEIGKSSTPLPSSM